jgi:hypothetical protein
VYVCKGSLWSRVGLSVLWSSVTTERFCGGVLSVGVGWGARLSGIRGGLVFEKKKKKKS